MAGLMASLPSIASAEFLVSKEWWGSIGYTYRNADYDSGRSEVQNQVTTNINNKFHLWQDWFATGETRLNLSYDRTDSNAYDKENKAATGTLKLNFLPRSKMPLSIGYTLSDNRIYDDHYNPSLIGTLYAADDHIVSRQYFITQSYIGERFKINASHIHDSQDSSQQGLYSTDINSADLIWRAGNNDIQARYYEKEESREIYNEGKQSKVATVSHNFYPSDRFSTSTFGSHSSQNEARFDSASNTQLAYLTDINQISSTFLWRDLTGKSNITGGLRYFDIESESDANHGESDSVNGNLHYTYRVNKNFSTLASTNHTLTRTDEDNRNISAQRLGVNYTSDTLELDQYFYTWHGNAQTGVTTEDGETTGENLLAAGHTLLRNWNISRSSSARLSMTQGLATLYTDGELDRNDLSHNLTFSWSSNVTTSNRHAQITISDRRNLADQDDMVQLLTLQYSQRNRLNRHSSLSGNLTHQVSLYEYADTNTESTHTNTSALLRAEYARPFSFQILTITSDLKYIHNDAATSNMSTNDFSWDNKLRYSIGKIDSTLRLLLRRTDHERYNMIFFNVKRNF